MARLTFIAADGSHKVVEAPAGQTLLAVAQAHGIDLEGACEGSLACSTCHVVIAADWYGRLPKASADEEDMLDLAAGLTRTSRLSCQIVVQDAFDGLVVSVPATAYNMAISA